MRITKLSVSVERVMPVRIDQLPHYKNAEITLLPDGSYPQLWAIASMYYAAGGSGDYRHRIQGFEILSSGDNYATHAECYSACSELMKQELHNEIERLEL